MAPKNSGKEKAPAIEEEEEPLQALVIADSFDNRFEPLTLKSPRVRYCNFIPLQISTSVLVPSTRL